MSKGDIGINHAVKLVRDTAEELLAAPEPNADHRYAIEYTADAIAKALVGIDHTKTTITPVLQYQVDGKKFDTFKEARSHENAMTLAHQLENSTELYFGSQGSSDPEDIAKWLLKNYNVEPK